MKWLLLAVAVLVVAVVIVAVVAIVGALLPREHRASRTLTTRHSPWAIT